MNVCFLPHTEKYSSSFEQTCGVSIPSLYPNPSLLQTSPIIAIWLLTSLSSQVFPLAELSVQDWCRDLFYLVTIEMILEQYMEIKHRRNKNS